jgi:xylan 1,4-beta-xylosidase
MLFVGVRILAEKKMPRIIVAVFLSFVSLVGKGQLVLRGDYPDPSVARIGDLYWATATTSNWAPVFPLLASSDLIHWETKGFVFQTLPEWADYYFWAPEISSEGGKTYVYYSAHQKGGNLCVAVASADSPEGPYTDHGPLVCQKYGSIDAFPMRDRNGDLYLVWKEDANSVGKPTAIWASRLTEDRTRIADEKVELFRNDAPWESNLVEGVSIISHGDYYYAIYAAAGCCGQDCSYATGVARARDLLGPWEKCPRNPILSGEETWKCPGHGTAIEKDGRYYFLSHAYHRDAPVFTGRQGILREFKFTSDDWIEFLPLPSTGNEKVDDFKDQFEGKDLNASWQWSVFQRPHHILEGGRLSLFGEANSQWTFLAQKSMQPSYKVRVRIDLKATTAEAGLAAIGDEKNLAGISVHGGKVRLWKTHLGKDSVLAVQDVAVRDEIFLEMKVTNGKELSFAYSLGGRSYKTLSRRRLDGSFIPPWDRAMRVGILSRGRSDQKAVFKNFILYH